MTIATVRAHGVSAPLHTPFVTALRRTTTVETLIVEVTDTDGRSGYGEAPQVWQVTGASTAGARACVEEVLGPLLTGQDPDDLLARCTEVGRAVAGNEAAKAAADVALHDLAARRLGLPLVRLLGGVRMRVPTDVTLAAAHGIATMIGSMMEGPVGVGAAASLAAAHGTGATPDLDAAWWLARSPVRGGIRYDRAAVVLPDAPGLGVCGVG